MKIRMEMINSEEYRAESGMTLKREEGATPNGNEIAGRWVLRDPAGFFIDVDQYRNDLAERYNLDISINYHLTQGKGKV